MALSQCRRAVHGHLVWLIYVMQRQLYVLYTHILQSRRPLTVPMMMMTTSRWTSQRRLLCRDAGRHPMCRGDSCSTTACAQKEIDRETMPVDVNGVACAGLGDHRWRRVRRHWDGTCRRCAGHRLLIQTCRPWANTKTGSTSRETSAPRRYRYSTKKSNKVK